MHASSNNGASEVNMHRQIKKYTIHILAIPAITPEVSIISVIWTRFLMDLLFILPRMEEATMPLSR